MSRTFSTNRYVEIAESTKHLLNDFPAFLSQYTADSPRAIGDAIENILGDHFQDLLGEDCAEYSASFARRSMADLAFSDHEGMYYVVDVKTHREDTRFNMPQLTSVERLARLYEDGAN